MNAQVRTVIAAGLLGGISAASHAREGAPAKSAHELKSISEAERVSEIRQAQVWRKTDVASMNLKAGPPGGFAPHQDVTCDYVVSAEKLTGHSPKFDCALAPDDVVKVKYRETNGKVYAEPAATRLFWALGFGADGVYQVRLTCRGCPQDPWKATEPRLASVVFEHAIIERPMPGHEIESKPQEGWKFSELDLADPSQGGAPPEQRDALRLLAVFVQHTDNKASNQRLICLPKSTQPDAPPGQRCTAPFLYVHDLGSTFGRGALLNAHSTGSANFKEWSRVPLWKEAGSCETHLGGNLDHHTLKDPVVSEAGRRFLANLLDQLTDEQIRDMFQAASIDARQWDSPEDRDRNGTIDQWVAAFKKKREELTTHTCPR